MKLMIAFLFVFSISAVFSSAQTAAPSNHAADKKAILKLNETVLKAHNAGDVATVDRIEDADFLLSGDFGEISKKQELDEMRSSKDNAPLSSIKLTTENAHVRFYGNTALLTEVEKWDNPDAPDGYETTSLWVRHGSDWKLAHLHYSKINKKQ